jgi:LysR family glycine cleavage system transcriptional activator
MECLLNALQQIDQEIEDIRGSNTKALCIGALTYFSSRWLSPRLMDFFEKNAGVSLRIEPVNSIADLKTKDVDFAILWGVGEWKEYESRLLLGCPPCQRQMQQSQKSRKSWNRGCS